MTPATKTESRPSFPRLYLVASATLVWAVSVVAGMAMLWNYASRGNAPGATPAQWPPASALTRSTGRYTVVVVVHPHCACSRATIGELAVLMARTARHADAYALFVQLAGFDDRWVETDLWQSAAAIPGVSPVRDRLGNEARRFGAETSGQTIVYGPDGKLLFSGGITLARGHAGDNAGLTSVIEAIGGNASRRMGTSVFGCSLFAARGTV